MIIFYPKNLDLWNDEFDFNNSITLVPKEKTNFKSFYDRDELLGFLKGKGVNLNNGKNPLTIFHTKEPYPEYIKATEVFEVKQENTLGWLVDIYK